MIRGQKAPKDRKPRPYTVPPGHVGLISLYQQYRRNAFNNGRPFELSLEAFRELTSSNCYYCGLEPSQIRKQAGSTSRPAAIERGKYVYTGLDRINNDLGYTLENSRPCCRVCNFAKSSMTEEEFLAWVKRLVKFQTKEAA